MFKIPTLSRGLTALALVGALTLSACDTVEPEDGAGEEEFITQVELTLVNDADASDVITITASDPEQDGLEFSPASVALTPGASYSGTIEFNDTINNEDITEEIEEEAEEHRIAYSFVNGSAGSVTVTDRESDYTTDDENNGDFEVGLAFDVDVDASASGSTELQAILYHFDDAPKTSSTDVSDEIDIEVRFPVTFQ